MLNLLDVIVASGGSRQGPADEMHPAECIDDEKPYLDEENSDSEHEQPAAEIDVQDYANLSKRQKKWMELRRKMVSC